jgi:hypothetical protein
MVLAQVGWLTNYSRPAKEDSLIMHTTVPAEIRLNEGLRQMYAEQRLIIPTITYGRPSEQSSRRVQGGSFHAALPQSLEDSDSIFIFVPFDNGQTTRFYQPYFKEP